MPAIPFRSAIRSRLLPLVLALAMGGVSGGPAAAERTDPEGGPVPVLVKARAPLSADVIRAISQYASQTGAVWPEIRGLALLVSPSRLDAITADPLVESVELDVEGGLPPDELAANLDLASPLVDVLSTTDSAPIPTWNLDLADATGSEWTGAGVTIAVVDGGLPQNWREFLPEGSVDLTHATGFGGEGWGDFHNPVAEVQGVGGWLAQFPHGVAVSSVIVGFPSALGTIAGAAPGATLVPIGILSRFNTAWSSWSIAGILHAANLKASGAIPGPMVINFSLQYRAQGTPTLFRDAVLYAISQGVLFVTIAGNFHPFDQVSFPGRMPECITAAAAGWRSEGLASAPWFFADVPEGDGSQVYVAPFSGRELPSTPAGSQIDVLAPGSFVFGEWLAGPGFSEGHQVAYDAVSEFIFGTSFAAPHVTGIVARMLEKNPALTQSEAQAILRNTALHVPSAPPGVVTGLQYLPFGWDDRATGAGLVQGEAAVAATPSAALAQSSRASGASAATAAVANAATRSSSAAGDATAAGGPAIALVTAPGRLPVAWAIRGGDGAPFAARIFDVQGRTVRRLTTGSGSAGRLEWDGTRDDGARAVAGVYLLRVDAARGSEFSKVVVAR